jgi:hypothetical protein
MLWLELWNRAPRDAEVAGSRHRLDRRWREVIAKIVRDGIGAGEFQAVDADDFALRFASLVDGLAIQVVLDDPDVPRSRMLEVCLRIAGDELGFDAPSALGSGAIRQASPAATPAPSSAARATARRTSAILSGRSAILRDASAAARSTPGGSPEESGGVHHRPSAAPRVRDRRLRHLAAHSPAGRRRRRG